MYKALLNAVLHATACRPISHPGIKIALGILQNNGFTIVAKILYAFWVLFQYVL